MTQSNKLGTRAMIKTIYEGVYLKVYEVQNKVVQLKKDEPPPGLVEKQVGDNILVTHAYLKKGYGVPLSNYKVVSSQNVKSYVTTDCLVLTSKDDPIIINELGYLVRPTVEPALSEITCNKDKLYILDDPNIRVLQIRKSYTEGYYWVYVDPTPSYFMLREAKQDKSILPIMADHCDRYNTLHYNIDNGYYKIDITNEEKLIKAIGCKLKVVDRIKSGVICIKLPEIERIEAIDSQPVLMHESLGVVVPNNINKLTFKNGLYRHIGNIMFINEGLDITKYGYMEIGSIKNKIITRNLQYVKFYYVKGGQIVELEGSFVRTQDIEYRLVKTKEEKQRIKELAEKYKSILPPNVTSWRLGAEEKYIEAIENGYLDKPTINILGYIHEISEEDYALIDQANKTKHTLTIQTNREKEVTLYKSIDLCSVEVRDEYQSYGTIKAMMKLWTKENKYHLIKTYIDRINISEFEKLMILMELEKLIASN